MAIMRSRSSHVHVVMYAYSMADKRNFLNLPDESSLHLGYR